MENMVVKHHLPSWVCNYLLFQDGVNSNILSISFNIILADNEKMHLFQPTNVHKCTDDDLVGDFINALRIVTLAKNIYVIVKKANHFDLHNGIRKLMENSSLNDMFLVKTIDFWEEYMDVRDKLSQLDSVTIFKTALKFLQVMRSDFKKIVENDSDRSFIGYISCLTTACSYFTGPPRNNQAFIQLHVIFCN